MEIVAIGSDIVECLRIGRMIEQHGEVFLMRVFTEREIHYCQARKHATEHFAALWAAKEAIMKCLGTAGKRGPGWTEMEIRIDANGQPRVHVCGAAKDQALGLRVSDILVTIAHCRAYATATAIAIRQAAGETPSVQQDAQSE
jgi:holo-[acyl-carrier protein] synthase